MHVQNGVPTAVPPPHIQIHQTHSIPCIEISNRSQLRLTHENYERNANGLALRIAAGCRAGHSPAVLACQLWHLHSLRLVCWRVHRPEVPAAR